jgi:DNA-binding MarR family transcriptional regulator
VAPAPEAPPLGFLVVRLAEAVDRRFVGALAELALKPRELRLLVVVDEARSLSQRRLADDLGIDAGNLVAVLDDLQGRGLLERPRDPEDRRQRLVTLTESGARTLEAARRATAAVEDEVFAALSPSERRQLHGLTLRAWRRLRADS